jgi:putative heme-binding domain-containing protein
MRDAKKPTRRPEARVALASDHRLARESAARTLAGTVGGREFLRKRALYPLPGMQAASLEALLDRGDQGVDLRALAEGNSDPGLRAMAVHGLAARGEDVRKYLTAKQPEVVRAAVTHLTARADLAALRRLLTDEDPFLRQAAVRQLSLYGHLLAAADLPGEKDAKVRVGLLLAHRASEKAESRRLVAQMLADPDEEVRFLAAKWVADEKLTEHRPAVVAAMKRPDLSVRLFTGLATALARLDGREVTEARLADYFLERLADERAPLAQRVKALQGVPASHPKLTVGLLGKLLSGSGPELQLEAVRALADHPGPRRVKPLLQAARNEKLPAAVRAEAVVGLAEHAGDVRDDLLRFAIGEDAVLRDEALRALTGTKLTAAERAPLEGVARRHAESAALVGRVLGRSFATDRPAPEKTETWLTRLEGPANSEAGRRVFFQPKAGGCFRCHRIEGRGRDVGPDLSGVGRAERRHLLQAILEPSVLVAPRYQAWHLETAEGKVFTGMLVRTYLDEYTYLDERGEFFKLNTRQVATSRPVRTSIMPGGLADQLTDQELRDLLAYLGSRR